MASSEFRRQHSRVYWSSFHEDMAMSALGSPIPRASPAVVAAAAATPAAAAAAAPGSPALESPGQEVGLQGSRDSSSSPSTSHKSQDSGFSDSDGSHRAAASPLSSSPEVTEQLPCTPSPTHTRLQLCLSGACTSTPRDRREAPATFGGHATPGELRRRLSEDDSMAIQSRPLPAIPAPYRRQRSAEETRRDAEQRRLQRQLSRTSAALDTSLEDDADDDAGQLNQTFPLAGPPDSGHRAPRSFIKNRKAAVTRRQQHPRFARTVSMYAATPGAAAAAPLYAVADSESVCSTPATPHHTTVLHVLQRSLPDGGEDASAATEAAAEAAVAEASVAELPDDTIQRHLLLDVTAGPGLPAHTSTPKAAVVAAPSPKLMPPPAATPTRRPSASSGAAAGTRRGHERRASARPVNLLHNYDKDEAAARVVQGPVGDVTGAVSAWLGGLRLSCEPECSVTLQSKALLGADPKGLRQLSGVQLASPQGLGHLQRRAHQLSVEYTKLCGRVQRGSLDQVGAMTQTFILHVLEFLEDHVDAVPAASERAGRLRSACERLRADATKADPEPADMAASLAAVRAALTATVDAILEKQVQELVNVLEGPASPLSLRTAVSALCALGRQGSALSELVVRCGGVRALLQVVLDARTSGTRRAALRALSAVCCTARAVRALEQAGGVEVVAELLSEAGRAEEERAEAAAVLAQITAPWVPDNARVEGLAQHLDAIVHALTRLVRGASSGEVLLLAAAALSHLSYVETSAVWPLLTAGAAGAVLQAVRAQGARCSVFLQEQAATLIANMSAVPEARAELAAERAVVALLCFLQLRPSPLQRAADIAAAERVQHKAAIALSRLASDPVVAGQVVSLEGVPRLVRLCRDEKERNHSDGVLVACLAALRKIAANCDSVVLSKRDHRELLEPRLLDSFMLFSTRQESYV